MGRLQSYFLVAVAHCDHDVVRLPEDNGTGMVLVGVVGVGCRYRSLTEARRGGMRRRPGPAGDATYIHINIEQSTGGRRIRTMSVESVISERERENAMKGGG